MTEETMLAAAFLASLPPARREGVELPEVAAQLLRMMDAARKAWPDLRVEPVAVVTALGARITADLPALEALRRIHFEDFYLARACVARDPRATEALDRRLDEALSRALPRLGAPPDLIDDVKQSVREALMVGSAGRGQEIADFSGRGPLAAWLRVMAVRRAVRGLQDRRKQQGAGDDALVALVASGEPELEHIKAVHRPDFLAAFAETLRGLPSRSRNLLRHQVVDGMTPEEIGALYGVHRITVGRWLAEIRDEIHKGTRKALMSRLDLGKAEAEELIVLVRSQIEISFDRLLVSASR